MDFILDKKHEMARSLFRDFAQNEVKPLAQEVDETEQFPVGTVEKMQKLGFMGIPVPQEPVITSDRRCSAAIFTLPCMPRAFMTG